MRDSKKITISAVTTALSLALLLFGTFVPMFDISCVFLSSILIMLPLYKKTILGAFLSYLATLILACIFCFANFNVIIPYAIFFGLHPIINELQNNKKLNKYLMFFIKAVWFVGSLFIMYLFTQLFADLNANIKKIIYYALPIGGFLFFIVYDLCVIYFRKNLDNLLRRIGL